MTEATRAKWKERVAAWRASGQSADAFAGDKNYEASTLQYWASRLKKSHGAGPADVTAPVMARVIRRRPRVQQAAPSPRSPGDELAVVVGDAQIKVVRGFDPALLREVIAALGGAK